MLIQNKYMIQEKIGEGTYSTVYLAKHITKGNNVAIKIDKKDKISQKLMKHEINVYLHLVKKNMTNISSFKSFGYVNNQKFIIMEYLKMDLRSYVSNNKAELSMIDINNLMMQCFTLLKKYAQNKYYSSRCET